MLRNILAVIIGLVVGSAMNMALIKFNMDVLFPVPAGADMNDPAQFNSYLAMLPWTAFIVIMVAHLQQSFFGGLIAATLGKSHPMTLAMIVGGLSLAGGLVGFFIFDGPGWLAIELPLYLVVAWAAGRLVEKRRASKS